MDGFKRRTEAKKERIIEAITSSLHLPYENIRIADVAKEANVSQVTLYNYFGNKDELLAAAVIHQMEQMVAEAEILIADGAPFLTKLTTLMAQKNAAAKRIHPSVIGTISVQSETFRTYIQQDGYLKSMTLFRTLLEQGQREGSIRADVKIDHLMLYIELISETVMRGNEAQLGALWSEEVQTSIMEFFCYGFMAQQESD
ncbi:MAG: TetR/AcrR family transcriptional regulator [Bacilli bacterium]